MTCFSYVPISLQLTKMQLLIHGNILIWNNTVSTLKTKLYITIPYSLLEHLNGTS